MDLRITRRWFFGLTLAGSLAAQKNQPAAQGHEPSPAEHYFTDVVLVNQFGPESLHPGEVEVAA